MTTGNETQSGKPRSVTIYHSPDADDAFMFYGLVHGGVGYPGYEFLHELSDIESLNHRAKRGELEVTAISIHTYPYLGGQYAILPSGASMGGASYGPRVVATAPLSLSDGVKRAIAIPGEMTSTALALQIWMREVGVNAELVSMHFDQIQHAVRRGEVDAGAIIHEGQITLEREGLTTVLDLGVWWWERTGGLPLPLGINVAKKTLGEEGMRAAGIVLRDSINYSLAHRAEALEYALQYGRGLSMEDADTFVGMYVNEWTQDLGEKGRESIRLFLSRGVELGIIASTFDLEFVDLAK